MTHNLYPDTCSNLNALVQKTPSYHALITGLLISEWPNYDLPEILEFAYNLTLQVAVIVDLLVLGELLGVAVFIVLVHVIAIVVSLGSLILQ